MNDNWFDFIALIILIACLGVIGAGWLLFESIKVVCLDALDAYKKWFTRYYRYIKGEFENDEDKN